MSFLVSLYDRVDASLIDYIDRHNAAIYDIERLVEKGASRIASKNFYSDGILLSGKLLNWLFTKERVGRELMTAYRNLWREIAKSTKLVTTKGEFPLSEMRVMIIAPDLKDVYVVTKRNIIGRLCYSDYRTKEVKADDISKVCLRIAADVNSVLVEKKTDFKAIVDFCNVLTHLLPDTPLNTSLNNIDLFLQALNSLDSEDEDFHLLVEMAPDLLKDLTLIFTNMDIYWG